MLVGLGGRPGVPSPSPLLGVGAINILHRGEDQSIALGFSGRGNRREGRFNSRWAWPRHQGQQRSFDLSRPRWHASSMRAVVTAVEVPPSAENAVPASEEAIETVSTTISRFWRTSSAKLRRIFHRLLSTSRLVAIELTLSSSTRLLSCLRLRHLVSGEAIAKPWTLSRPSSRQSEGQCS